MKHIAVEVVGWIGVTLMLAAYLLLILRKVGSGSAVYQWMNVFAGAGLLVNSGLKGAFPSAFINIVWMAISFYGLVSRPRQERGGR